MLNPNLPLVLAGKRVVNFIYEPLIGGDYRVSVVVILAFERLVLLFGENAAHHILIQSRLKPAYLIKPTLIFIDLLHKAVGNAAPDTLRIKALE